MNSSVASPRFDASGRTEYEFIEVCYRPAGFWLRLIASILDLMIVGVLNTFLSIGALIVFRLAFLSAGADVQTTTGFLAICYYILSLLVMPFVYFGFFLNKFGATPAKLLFGMKVATSRSGEHLGIFRGYFREVWVKGIMFLLLGIPFLLVPCRGDRRGIHDFIVSSCVLKRTKG